MKILGIDLAGKTTNPTGICLLNNDTLDFKTVFSDEQILEILSIFKPDIIAIDAPIMSGKPRNRKADKLLKKYKALSPSMPTMKSLTIRGSKLATKLVSQFKVIEVFPTATAKILRIYSKNYRKIVSKLEINVKNKHELDAYLCCLTAKMFLEGKTNEIGDEAGKIVVPKQPKLTS